jgi:hypothetical protein
MVSRIFVFRPSLLERGWGEVRMSFLKLQASAGEDYQLLDSGTGYFRPLAR